VRHRIKGVPERGLIFTGVRGGILNPSGNWHKNHWSKVLNRAEAVGILTKATPHKFRHSHATSLRFGSQRLDRHRQQATRAQLPQHHL
jgi:integrase